MNYNNFLKSIRESKLHFLDETKLNLNLGLKSKFEEPHYFISTSGTQSQKDYIFSLSKVVKAAEMVVNHYNLSHDDRWYQSLSTKHVGGFLINARSYVAKMKIPYKAKWSPTLLIKILEEENISLLSLVPTQVFDLVSFNLKAPKSIKHVFVGGAALNSSVYDKAISLGWPLRPCFGMTETLAQFSYSIDGKSCRPYPGWSFDISDSGFLKIKGPALFSYQVMNGNLVANTADWYQTGDLVKRDKNGTGFLILGRGDGLVKQKSEFKDFKNLKSNFENLIIEHNLIRSEFEILAINNLRNDMDIVVVSENNNLDLIRKIYKLDIKGIFYVNKIPRTELMKLKKSSLSDVLKKQILFY